MHNFLENNIMKTGKIVAKIQDQKAIKTGVIAQVQDVDVKSIPYVDPEWFEPYSETRYTVFWTDGDISIETSDNLVLIEDLVENK